MIDHVRLEEVLGWPVNLDGCDEGVVDGRCHIAKTLVEHVAPRWPNRYGFGRVPMNANSVTTPNSNGSRHLASPHVPT